MQMNSLNECVRSLSPTKRQELSRLITRHRPNPVDVFHLAGMVPDAWQKSVLLDTSSRSLLNCSRQSGKSTVAAVLAVYEAVFHPPALILLLSPSLRQSGLLFKAALDLYRRLPNPPRTIGDSAARLELKNGSQIISLPGAENTVRGYSSVRLLIVDEAAHVADDLYWSIRPMLAISGGRFIGLSTPFGKRGWFFDSWISAEDWTRHSVTCYEVPRISAAFIERERKDMPRMKFESEYLCQFHTAESCVFDDNDIQRALDPSVVPLFG